MFSSSISAGSAAPTASPCDPSPDATQAGSAGASFDGRAGARRAGAGEGPAAKRRAVKLIAGIQRTSTLTPSVPQALRDELLDSDIDWAALRGHWENNLNGTGPKRMGIVQRRLFNSRTKSLIRDNRKELWQRFELQLDWLRQGPGHKAAEVALEIANHGMAAWAKALREWEACVQAEGPGGCSREVAERAAPDIAVIPKKIELVKEAHALETAQLGSAGYFAVRRLRQSAIGKAALSRAAPLLHVCSTVKVTDADTGRATDWFEMMSLDPQRPMHQYINHFSRGIVRLQNNYRQQNTKDYSLSDVVLHQLLSIEAIDPAEIAMIELVHVDAALIQWLGRHATARRGIDAGDGIPWREVPVDLFIDGTEQGRLVGELAHALGKVVRHAWSFEYLPDARGRPAPDGQPATVSADEVRLDVLAFIAPPLRGPARPQPARWAPAAPGL